MTLRVAEALGAARRRGVDVEVVLDEHGDVEGEIIGVGGRNQMAYDYLSAQGVDVYFDDEAARVHAKAVIVDGETALIGSNNWTEGAFSRNVEACLLVRDKTVAGQALAALGKVKKRKRAAEEAPGAYLPVSFLMDANGLGRMVRAGDQRAFDVYLHLLKEKKKDFQLDYDALARGLGIEGMGRRAYRRQITRALLKLQDRYGLVKVTLAYGDNAAVVMEDTPGDVVAVPTAYWDFGWDRKLRFAGKVMYLLNRHYSGVSPARPRWSAARETLAARHHVSLWFVGQGTTELRRANLVEVEYDKLTKDVKEPRFPNIYTPRPLYDWRALEKKWEELEAKHGAEKVRRARECAALVYEDSDLAAVEMFIDLEETYGQEKIRRAFAIIGEKRPDNPKREVGYFVNTVKKL